MSERSEQFGTSSAGSSKKSIVWTLFDDNCIDSSKVTFKVCNAAVSRGRTKKEGIGITNLWAHLDHKHKSDAARRRQEDGSKKSAPAPVASQPSIEESLPRSKPYDADDHRPATITRLIMEMLALNDLPFHFVEQTGFRRLMKYLDARYKVPTEKHFRQRMLPDVYDAVRKGVCDVITEAETVSLTTDTWSTPQCISSVISLTAHWIDDNWTSKSAMLNAADTEGIHSVTLRGGTGGSAYPGPGRVKGPGSPALYIVL